MKLLKQLYLKPQASSEYHTTSLSLRDESFLSPGKGGLEDLLGSRDFKGGRRSVSGRGTKRDNKRSTVHEGD